MAIVVNKSMACAIIHAYDAVKNDDFELHDLEGHKVSKLFGKGPMSYRHGGYDGTNGAPARVSWGPEGW